MRNRWFVLILAATLCGVGARASFATPDAGLPAPTIDVNGTQIPLADLGCASPGSGGPIACSGTGFQSQSGGFALDNWNFELNPDPKITSTFTLTNLSSLTQNFTITITLPIASLGPGIAITGSTTNGVLTDLNANGATLIDFGSAIFTNLVNSAALKTLLDPAQLYVAPADPFGGPSSVAIPDASYGPIVLNQTADANMQIKWQFRLTGNDQFGIKGVFDVQPAPVPEPGTLLLLGSGLAALARFGRTSGRRPAGRSRC